MKRNTLKATEFILVTFVWLVIIAAPLLFNENNYFEWRNILQPLEVNIPLFFLFLLNRFVFVPQILFKKKRIAYILSIVGLISLLTIGTFIYEREFGVNPPDFQNKKSLNSPAQIENLPPHLDQVRRLAFNPPPAGRHMPPFINLLIFSFLIVGFDTGLMASFKLAKAENEKANLEKENIESQLAFLRNQVSPHFFMNTLNNIHALIDIDTEEAKESIIKLSKLMRHILYESEAKMIPIKKELGFIQNYIDLMRLRFSDKVKISFNYPESIPDKLIPPLLSISFLENAFKYGVSYNSKSFIDISFLTDNDMLNIKVSNSNHKTDKNDEASGIGLVNAKKRLSLIYNDNYNLDIKDDNNIFTVNLSIPI